MDIKILSPRLDERKSPPESYLAVTEDASPTTPSWSVSVFLMFVVFGIASLTPWNMFITATAYFESKFAGSSPDIEKNFPNYFQTGAICADVVVSFLTVPLVRYIKMPRLIYLANSVMLATFVLTALLAKVDSTQWSSKFFILTEVSFCTMCGGGAMYISTMWAITSSLDPLYIDAFLIGMTLAGIIASLLNILTLSIPGVDFVGAGFWYFVSAGVILLLAMVLFTQFHCQHYQEDYRSVDTESPSGKVASSTCQLNRRILPQGYSCFCVLYITFLMFPAVLSNLVSGSGDSQSAWTTKYYKPVSLFLIFNLGDLVGRVSARVVQFPGARLIPWYTTARAVFVLLMVMCNLLPRDIPVWFKHDAIPTTLVFFFALTSGQVLTLCLRYAARLGTDKAEKATIGTIMAVYGAIGRILGSLSTYLIFMAIR